MHLRETCQVAGAARARRLWLTHFSPAVPDPLAHAAEAAALCPAAEIGQDGMTATLTFRDE